MTSPAGPSPSPQPWPEVDDFEAAAAGGLRTSTTAVTPLVEEPEERGRLETSTPGHRGFEACGRGRPPHLNRLIPIGGVGVGV